MTRPRRHLPGQVAMITRRCVDGRMLLRPDKFVNGVMGYEAGRALGKVPLGMHGMMVMSNHIHMLVTDKEARRSEFMQGFAKEVGSRRNRDLGRMGPLWQPNHKFNDVVILDGESLEERLLYVWLNPVKDGLVDKVEDWPGFKILPKDWGEELEIEVPGSTYGRGSSEKVVFVPEAPPVPLGMSLEQKRRYYEERIREEEGRYREERKKEKKRVLGVENVLRLDPLREGEEKVKSAGVGPFFAVKDRELWIEAMETYAEFLREHERARLRLRARKKKGKKKRAVFPAGTVKMRWMVAVRCRKPPQEEPGIFLRECG